MKAGGVSLAASGARFAYPGRPPAVDGVDLECAPGTLTCLVGPNGSGKSTLLRLLAGVLRPAEGEVRVGDALPAARSRALLARDLAFLPAQPRVPADYTTRAVVLMGRHPFGRGLLLDSDADRARADAALARCGAAPFAERVCADLSGGERQRVLVARAVCQGAPAVLLDEPTSAQDLAHVEDLFGLFAELAREGRTVVVATHALNAAARVADRLVFLAGGRKVADGPPTEVFREDVLRDVFEVEVLVGHDGALPFAVPRGRAAGGQA